MNIGLLCVDWHGISDEVKKQTDYASHVFTLIFLCEIIMKMVAHTAAEFWRN